MEVLGGRPRGHTLGTGWREEGCRKWPGRAGRKTAEGFGWREEEAARGSDGITGRLVGSTGLEAPCAPPPPIVTS